MLGQQKSGDVGASDQKHKRDCAQQCEQCRFDVPDDFIHESVDNDSLTFVDVVPLLEPRSNRVHLGPRLLECDTRLEPAQYSEHMRSSDGRPLSAERHWRPELFFVLIERDPTGGCGPCRIDSGRHHAPYCVAAPVQGDCFVNDSLIGAITALPESMP